MDVRIMKRRRFSSALVAVAAVCAAAAVAASPLSEKRPSPIAPSSSFLAVPTSFDGKPSDVMSSASAQPVDAGGFAAPGLFERESPPGLVWAALLLGVARVAKAVYVRRKDAGLPRLAGRRTVAFGRAIAAAPFMPGSEFQGAANK